MHRTANVVSYVFHPLWMPLMTFAGVYFLDPFLGLHPKVFRLLLLILMLNLVAPGLSILLMRQKRFVSDLDITIRRERFLPFAMFLFYFGLSYVWVRMYATQLHMPTIVLSVFSALIVSLLISTLITLLTKISMHTMAMGAICGVFAGVNQVHLLGLELLIGLLIIIAGVVGWARLTLGVHTHAQVYLGFLLGFLVHFFMLSQGWFI